MGNPSRNAKVDKRGRVICPVCGVPQTVPNTHVLNTGWGKCPNGHDFYINAEAVEAFHFFLSRQGSDMSRQLSKDREGQELPKDLAEGLRGVPED